MCSVAPGLHVNYTDLIPALLKVLYIKTPLMWCPCSALHKLWFWNLFPGTFAAPYAHWLRFCKTQTRQAALRIYIHQSAVMYHAVWTHKYKGLRRWGLSHDVLVFIAITYFNNLIVAGNLVKGWYSTWLVSWTLTSFATRCDSTQTLMQGIVKGDSPRLSPETPQIFSPAKDSQVKLDALSCDSSNRGIPVLLLSGFLGSGKNAMFLISLKIKLLVVSSLFSEIALCP